MKNKIERNNNKNWERRQICKTRVVTIIQIMIDLPSVVVTSAAKNERIKEIGLKRSNKLSKINAHWLTKTKH